MLTKYTAHPYCFILLPILGLIATFTTNSVQAYAGIALLMSINLVIIARPLKLKILLYFSLALIPALLAMFVSSYFFTTGVDAINSALNHRERIELAWLLSFRLYLLAMISFSFMLNAPQEKIILNLLQQRILPTNLGFALLAVNNAVSYLGEEFKRIQIAYQMRYQRRSFSPKIILPLLVAAARYSHHLSISMHARGLNNARSYHQSRDKFTGRDALLVVVNLIVLLGFLFGI